MFKKTICIALTFSFIFSYAAPLYSYVDIPIYLVEYGLRFYKNGQYDEALREFKKALIIEPNYEPAKKYIKIIEEIKAKREIGIAGRAGVIKTTLDKLEPGKVEKEVTGLSSSEPRIEPRTKKKVASLKVLILSQTPEGIPETVPIELGKSIMVIGKNIKRFLVIDPVIIEIKKDYPDKIEVSGKNIGYTYLYVWDDNGRTTLEFQGVFPVIEGQEGETSLSEREAKSRNFKLRYDLSWASFETGRRINTANRAAYNWNHNLQLTGETPYGNLDSGAAVRSQRTTTTDFNTNLNTDLTSFTMGLTEGRFEQFSGFTLRGFDYSPYFSNLSFPGSTLRGAMFSSPVADKKLDYTLFWGREGGGRYGNLSPTLGKIKNSFLEGLNLNYSPQKEQNYKFSLLHGWGRDRDSYLNEYNYNLKNSWGLGGGLGIDYEIANDTERLAHILNTHYGQSRLNLNLALRDINRHFTSIVGSAGRQGELGGLLRVNYAPTDDLFINSSLDVYRDRLYPAQDTENRLNENFNWNLRYQLDRLTYFNMNYSLNNNLGTNSQYRYQNQGLGLYRNTRILGRKAQTYVVYYHQANKNYSSHTSDYINEKVYAGTRIDLMKDFYYYLNREFNWFEERFTNTRTRPNALETGLDLSKQIAKSPIYINSRFTYRDEEDTLSDLSFLAGEDYIEGYSELTYRPNANKEIYGAFRYRNVWAERPDGSKRVELAFNAGMRYLWDTGIRWESIGAIDGFVFKDYNQDGLKGEDEPGVKGIKLLLGQDDFDLTDEDGYYRFENVKAKMTTVTIDSEGIPPGFNLTTSKSQVATVRHGKEVSLDFGIMTLTEIFGTVFLDNDENGKLNLGDKGIKGVIISLEDGTKVATDIYGRFFFRKAPPGEHTLKLDIDSLPIDYLPTVPIIQKITLTEGLRHTCDFPVKKTQP